MSIETPLQKFYQYEKERSDKTFLRQPYQRQWHHITWKKAGDDIRRMATALKAMDLPPQSKIALISKNCAHWCMADLAIMMAGHVSVPLYPTIGADMINHILKHSESKVLFVGKLDDWEPQRPGVPDGIKCISFPFWTELGYDTWDDIVAKHEPMQGEVTRDMDELFTIIYTSGTTGLPKGVVHSLRAVSSAATWAFEQIDDIKTDGSERFFSYLPLSHIAERLLVQFGGLYTGSVISFAESLEDFPQNLKDTQPTIFFSVPRLWTVFQSKILEKMPQKKMDLLLKIPIISGIVKNKIKAGLGLDKAKYLLSGAAPLAASSMHWYDKLDMVIYEAYGMTENCAYSHINMKGARKIGTVGKAWNHADVRISDEGEIQVKSAATMLEYYKEPEKTAEVITKDGYLRTGDQGEIDSEGFLKITGRVKDIFKTDKGKYVAPAPIELALSKNTAIEQVCLVGLHLIQPIALVVLTEDARDDPKEEIKKRLEATLKEVNPTLDKHEKIAKIVVMKDPWTIENKILTPTMKIKRNVVDETFKDNYVKWFDQPEGIVWE